MPHKTIEPSDIVETAERIRAYVRRTPTIDLRAEELGLDGASVTLKLELLQHAGSFKARGAFTNLLTRVIPEAGVVAASGGNHGAALAYAAGRVNVPAKIFVPTVASPAKTEQIVGYGAELVIGGDRYADALEASERWSESSGALAVHAYDQYETLVGQATTAVELSEQSPDLDTVLVAVGGGGLIGGMAAWYRGRTKLVGVEPEASPTLYRALEAGEPVDAPSDGIASDSLAPRRVGSLMFPIAQSHVDRVVLVSDDDIRTAQNRLWKTLRIVAEPGGAAAFAALLSGKYRPVDGERIGVLICGGNTTAVSFEK